MLLADIHNANLTSDERGPQKPEQVDISLLNDLLEESAEKSRIRAFAEEINAHLLEDHEGSEPTQLSHTDLNPDNILWAGFRSLLDRLGAGVYGLLQRGSDEYRSYVEYPC